MVIFSDVPYVKIGEHEAGKTKTRRNLQTIFWINHKQN